MIPTAYLRFVKRNQFITIDDFSHLESVVEVLQQWWADHSCDAHVVGNPGGSMGEWRDVEMVNEGKK